MQSIDQIGYQSLSDVEHERVEFDVWIALHGRPSCRAMTRQLREWKIDEVRDSGWEDYSSKHPERKGCPERCVEKNKEIGKIDFGGMRGQILNRWDRSDRLEGHELCAKSKSFQEDGDDVDRDGRGQCLPNTVAVFLDLSALVSVRYGTSYAPGLCIDGISHDCR